MSEPLVRLAAREDAEAVLAIRNDPVTRVQSVQNQEPIPRAAHMLWFERQYFQGLGNMCFVLEIDLQVVGYCRYDLTPNEEYSVSIAVDPAYQGQGLGHELLSHSLQQLNSRRPVVGEVKSDNPASLKLFEKNGFQVSLGSDENYHIRYVPQG